MAHIEDRWYRTTTVDDKPIQVPKPGCGKGMRYRVRYYAPDGRERSESFPDKRKREAQAFLAKVQADIHRGTYVDPDGGRVIFQTYAASWLNGIASSQNTQDRHERQIRLHMNPVFGLVPLAAIQPTTIRAWQRRLKDSGMADGHRRLLFHDLSVILNAAVDDRMIPANPCAAKTVRPPKSGQTRVRPWSLDMLNGARAAMRRRFVVVLDLGAGCGLRQGEILGISPDDIDPDRPVLHVLRQLKLIRGQMVFAPPKTGKTREVPLPTSVLARMQAHADEFTPVTVTLPWDTLDGEPHTVRLLLHNEGGSPVHSRTFNTHTWKPALRAAKIPATRENGMHVLRHTYASVLLDAGESIKALSLYLGHADPGFTLRIYTHLLPASEDRTRRAIDRAFGYFPDGDAQADTADSPDGPADTDGLGTA